MAQYKVPQDVEAEDKLLGPFTFRQFIYLLIAAIGIAGAWGLYQIFPLLAIIPVPFSFFFGILALPIKKDQPMETYLAAIISFYLKPNRRIWTPGQRESTIKITAPKKVEKSRTKNITEDEASHRLSFLANIVDTEGYAIRGESLMQDEYAAEANTVEDILDQNNPVIDQMIANEQKARKEELVREMRTAMNRANNLSAQGTTQPISTQPIPAQQIPVQPFVAQNPVRIQAPGANYQAPAQQFAQPTQNFQQFQQPQQFQQQFRQPQQYQQPQQFQPTQNFQQFQQPQQQQFQPTQPTATQKINPTTMNQATLNKRMQDLANNPAFSVQTIAEQAKRLQNQSNNNINNFSA